VRFIVLNQLPNQFSPTSLTTAHPKKNAYKNPHEVETASGK
jgi:hypothetical protein